VHRRIRTAPRTTARWLVVAALAAVLAVLVATAVGRAERARAEWGRRVPVVVTSAAIRPGDPLAGAVTLATWPAALAPDGALTSLDDLPDGATATAARAAGEPLTDAAIADPAHDRRPLVAVPTPGVRPELAVGDPVSLWATYDPSLAAGRATTARIDTEATVASLAEGAVVVAVEPERVGEVVEAASLATVTVVSERR